MIERSISDVARILRGTTSLLEEVLMIEMGGFVLGLRSNSSRLLERLEEYFAHVVSEHLEADVEVVALEREVVHLGMTFADWKREPGKTGRKDAYVDLADGRVVLKVRTGMLFLQSESLRLAAGPCLRFENQVINFVNSQYMTWLQHRRWLICHAAGVVVRDRCLAIAGFSGGGKSTLMLHLLEHEGTAYLTNDRLFVRRESGAVSAAGIAKLPRVNPGTVLHNPKLRSLIPADERAELARLPADELWQIEQKYDVHVHEIFGPDRIIERARLGALLVLNWRLDSDRATRIERVDLAERTDLLEGAVMKSPGPFFHDQSGEHLLDGTALRSPPYLDALREVAAYEATGRVDFTSVDEELLIEMTQCTDREPGIRGECHAP